MARSRKQFIVSLALAVFLLTLFHWTRLDDDTVVSPINAPLTRPPTPKPKPVSPPASKPPPSKPPTNADADTKEEPEFPHVVDSSTKRGFIKTASNVEFAGPIKHEVIQSVCASKEWREGVVFRCDHVAGGIGNVRNHLLNCIRYTIEGGGSLIMPDILRRKPDDITKIYTNDWVDLEYLFDKSWFKEHLAKGCPQLKIWEKLEDVPGYKEGKFAEKAQLMPGSLDSWVPKWGLAHPESWRVYFDKWLAEYEESHNTGGMIHQVGLGRAYLEYPVYHDGEDFVGEFGKILRLNEEARVLAATVLWEMKEKHFKDGGIDPEKEVQNGTYFGVHLRREADAVKAWPEKDWKFQRYDIQAKLSMAEIAKMNPPVVYVASGNLTEVAQFVSDVHTNLSSSIIVTTKYDLLSADAKKKLKSMTFDQAALVDMLVMERAAKFVGIGHSSFAWNVALKRHLLVKEEKSYLDGPFMLSDSLSQVFGNTKGLIEYPSCMWP